ncbi:helix-turn-helix transcriptional regulator [Actinomadura algeriensis]|uniref:DNA-binding transcriptional regulator YafY n=1 Tax=Actinomadura algeriensis TaxID=1679523 RepID=A0ABR9JRK0_9ACTN|nr:YafY family protein [Actinomadura algeriensis]MBE1532755.1 putative DNA-binding transcriptional regulator YafY [Actinomadura algeriensis]
MTDTPGRLLTLLSLLQTPREWPGGELAGRLGVSARTVRRDVDRLRGLGYPIEGTTGPDGGYRLVAGTAMPPLLLDDEEAVAIAVGLRTAAGNAVAGLGDAAARALAKLEQVLPARLRRRVGVLNAATVAMPVAGGPRVDPDVLAVTAAAIANTEPLRFAYTSADGTETRRRVEPYRLVAAGRRWYLLAHDTDRDDWRVFRADRITGPSPTGQRFAPREVPGGDAVAFVTDRMYALAPVHTATVTLRAPAEEVRVGLGAEPGDVTPLDGTSCRLETYADTLPWLAARLLMLGCEFTVHDPPELVEHLRDLGARATRATG